MNQPTRLLPKVAMAAVLAAITSPVALADPNPGNTVDFSISGPGIMAEGTLTYSVVNLGSYGTVPGYSSAWKVEGVTGTFQDTVLGITGSIDAVYPASMDYTSIPRPADYPNAGAPPNRGSIAGTGLTFGKISYDNLIYPGGDSPNTCPNYYSYGGGKLDLFGLLLEVNQGSRSYLVNVWSNGNLNNPTNPIGLDYGIAIGENVGGPTPFSTLRYLGDGNVYENAPGSYLGSGVSFTVVPEPSTYGLMACTALVGFGIWRRSRRA